MLSFLTYLVFEWKLELGRVNYVIGMHIVCKSIQTNNIPIKDSCDQGRQTGGGGGGGGGRNYAPPP